MTASEARSEWRWKEVERLTLEVARLRHIARDYKLKIEGFRSVAVDALDPIEEATKALAAHDIEIAGLSSTHADLQSTIN